MTTNDIVTPEDMARASGTSLARLMRIYAAQETARIRGGQKPKLGNFGASWSAK